MTSKDTELKFYPIDFKHLINGNLNKVTDYLQKHKIELASKFTITFALNHKLQLTIDNTHHDLIGERILHYEPKGNEYKTDYEDVAKVLLNNYQSKLKDELELQKQANLLKLCNIWLNHNALFSETAYIDYLVPKFDQITFEFEPIAIKNKHYLAEKTVSYWKQYHHLSVNVLNSLLFCANQLANDDSAGYLLVNAIEKYYNEHRQDITDSDIHFDYKQLLNSKIKFSNLSQDPVKLPLHIMVEGDTFDLLHKQPDINVNFQIEDDKDFATFTDILLQQSCLHNDGMYDYLNTHKNKILLNDKEDIVEKQAKALNDNFENSYFLRKLADIFNLLLIISN